MGRTLYKDFPGRTDRRSVATCYVNGKFLAQRTTGVQRFARELLWAVDARLATEHESPRPPHGPPGLRWVLLHPAGVVLPAYRCIETRRVGSPGLPLHWWEQWCLPRAAAGGLLLNLAGAAPWRAARQVCTLHDAALFDWPQAYRRAFRLWYRALFHHLARTARRVLTVSEFSRGRLAACLNLASQRIGVVPNGADHLARVPSEPAVLARLGLRPERYVLAVASANPSKNLARLEAAFARLSEGDERQADLRLVIVGGEHRTVFAGTDGRGAMAGGAASTVATAAMGTTAAGEAPASAGEGAAGAWPDASAATGVLRTGPIGDAELKALYEHALLLAFPSLYEGFGLPPLEAMACGCPVVAAKAAALPEVCGAAARYVDPCSVDDMAAALRELAADAPARDRLREAGRQRALQYTWHEAAGRLMQEVAAVA